jgi:hypothetical protein
VISDLPPYCSGSRGRAKGLTPHQTPQPPRPEQQKDRPAIDQDPDPDQKQKRNLVTEGAEVGELHGRKTRG